MAKKIRELIQYLLKAGFCEIKGTGKGSHKKYTMAKKIRELIQYLLKAGFCEIKGTGKGSHKKYTYALYLGAVTISGRFQAVSGKTSTASN